MHSVDYSKLEEITVKSQSELDVIPDDYAGIIYIEFGTYWSKAVVNKRYRKRVVARENSSVEAWVLDYGKDWSDLAILEVEANLKDIILPTGCLGKVRCAEVTVLREVPLEECGLYGKILVQRRKKRDL